MAKLSRFRLNAAFEPLRLACVATALVAAPSPAFAQYGMPPPPPPPTMRDNNAPPRAQTPTPTPTPVADVNRAAACAIGRDAALATGLLGTVPRSPEERSQAGALLRAAQRCQRSRQPMSIAALLVRGAAAETLYEVQFATPVAARTPALAVAPLPRPAAGDDPIIAALVPMYALAECAMPRQPDLVRALLATDPGTPEEASAMQALHPAFGACVPRGTPIRIDPRAMRAFFAEALYRWSVVQRDGAASPWAAPVAAPQRN